MFGLSMTQSFEKYCRRALQSSETYPASGVAGANFNRPEAERTNAFPTAACVPVALMCGLRLRIEFERNGPIYGGGSD